MSDSSLLAPSAHLSLLVAAFPARAAITPVEAGAFVGLGSSTTYMRVSKYGRTRGLDFPPTVNCSGRQMVRLVDFANWLDGLADTPTKRREPAGAGKKRGRPTKREQMERAAAAAEGRATC